MCPCFWLFFIFFFIHLAKHNYSLHKYVISSIDLHYKSLNLGICPNDYGNNRDLCNKSLVPIVSSMQLNYEYFEDNCACDPKCSAYNDCCADLMDQEEAKIYHERNWTCAHFPTIHRDHLFFALQSCAQNWIQSDVRNLCTNQPISLLQIIPAFSNRSGIMYRNIFCSVCNYESSKDILHWSFSIFCDQLGTELNHVQQYFAFKYFDPEEMFWRFEHNSVIHKCFPIIKEFSSYDAIINKFNVRPCKHAISMCPTSFSDEEIKSLCHSHTFYLYSKKQQIFFRNPYCALCNDVNISTLDCDLSAATYYKSWHVPQSSLSLLFDYQGINPSCPIDSGTFEIFDTNRKKCIPFFCGRLYKFNLKTFKCEKIDTNYTGLTSDCIKEFIPESEYIIMHNYSVLLKHSSLLLTESEYEHYRYLNKLTGAEIEGILICYNHQSNYAIPFVYDEYQEVVSSITLIISIICLIFHLTVHAIVPSLRNLHAKILMGLSASLLFASIAFLFGSRLRPSDENYVVCQDRGSWLCIIVAMVIHYAFLAAFTWMNTMAFDMLRCVRSTNRYKRFHDSTRIFKKYSLYSWLLPAFIVMIAAITDLISVNNKFKPLYGKRVCWISQKTALLIFFVGPVSFIIVVNFIIFALTAYLIIRTQNGAKKFKDSKRHQDRIKFFLFIKLALVMGLTWLTGTVAAFSSVRFMWYFFILLNGSQGAFIFISYTCTKNVYNELKLIIIDWFNLSSKKTASLYSRSTTVTSMSTFT